MMPIFHVLAPSSWLLAAAGVAAAGVVTGLTGFGFALVSVPALMIVLPPPAAVAAVLVMGEVADLANVTTARRHVDGGVFRGLLVPAAIGMVAGASVLRMVPPAALRLTAAGVVVLFTLLLLRRGAGKVRSGSRWRAVAGAASGLLTTTVGLSGPPAVLFLDAVMRDKHRSRATLAAYFAVISPAGLALLAIHGAVPADMWRPILLLTPVALLGRAIGSRLHRLTSPGTFRAITFAVMVVAGGSGAVSALAVLLRHA